MIAPPPAVMVAQVEKGASWRWQQLVESACCSHLPSSYYEGLPVKPGLHAFQWLLSHPSSSSSSAHANTTHDTNGKNDKVVEKAAQGKGKCGLVLDVPPTLLFGECGTDNEFQYLYTNSNTGIVESLSPEGYMLQHQQGRLQHQQGKLQHQQGHINKATFSTPQQQQAACQRSSSMSASLEEEAAVAAIANMFIRECMRKQYVLQPKQPPPPLHMKKALLPTDTVNQSATRTLIPNPPPNPDPNPNPLTLTLTL
jgi:hypothetical protein